MQLCAGLLVGLLSLLFQQSLSAQDARLHASTIGPGDLAVLEVSYRNQRPSMLKLDTTPLEKDFEVINVKSTIRMDPQAGSFGNTMHWRVLLLPKRNGTLRIPSLRIREAITPELQLTVQSVNPYLADGEDIRLELSVDKQTPRVGEQFNVRIRFFSNRTLADGYLSNPKPAATEQLGLGRDHITTQLIDGVEHQVLERNIAMFAESAGKLRIAPAAFRGSLAMTSAVGESATLRYFLRRSQAITIEVKPIASGFNRDDWYPLESATITQQWQIPEEPLKPGDQILRRITLQTTGLPVKRFAAGIFNTKTRGAEVYLDQPQRRQIVSAEALTAEYQQDQLFVIHHEGPLLLPPLQFDFWDSELDQAANIILDGKLLDVPPLQTNTGQAPANDHPLFSFSLIRVTMVILAIILLLAGLKRWQSARHLQTTYGYRAAQLKHACKRQDPVTAARQLLAWGRAQGLIGDSQGLRALALAVEDHRVSARLLELDTSLFARNPEDWQGKQTWIAIKQYRHAATEDIRLDALPPLYPARP